MNNKIFTLLKEGFSMNTLNTFNSNQINVLYERVKKSKKQETKEQSTVQPRVSTKQVKQIELPVGAETTTSGNATVQNNAGKTIITQTEGEMTERAKSKKQQQFFGIVRGIQKGEIPKKGKAGKASEEMKVKDVKDFAKTKHKGLPEKKKKETKENVKKLEESILKLVESYIPPQMSKSEIMNMIKKRK